MTGDNPCADLLKLSDETDLDILNSSMEAMVEQFQDELLPVAAQLTARLVSGDHRFWIDTGAHSDCAVRLVPPPCTREPRAGRKCAEGCRLGFAHGVGRRR